MLIECTNLSKEYGKFKALDDVNFTVEAGAPVALIGPNGAGKTTLFSILCGFQFPTQGQLTILGHEPGHPNTFGKLAALPQDAQLDPRLSVGHQMKWWGELQGLPTRELEDEIKRVLTLVELPHVIDMKPSKLSHGMRKRVSIAQALMGQPDIVLLDEPTAGLDPTNAINIRRTVENLCDQTTFVISSHNVLELEKLCDRVLYIEQGQLTEHDLEQQRNTVDILTLQTESGAEKVQEHILSLPGVTECLVTSKDNYVIKYDKSIEQQLDIKLLAMMAENGLGYRQLTKGQTLEQSLFDKV